MKRIIGLAVILLATALLAMGCSSGGEAKDSDTLNKEDNSKNDEKFKKSDKVATEYFKAYYETNDPKIREIISPKALGDMREDEKNSDIHVSPGSFEKLNGNYELMRYDNYFDEEDGEIYYKFETSGSKGDLHFIALKQNPEGEWKVRDKSPHFYSSVKEDIPDQDSGTVVHEVSGKEINDKEEEGDDYGFDE